MITWNEILEFHKDGDLKKAIHKLRDHKVAELALSLSGLPAAGRNFILNQVQGRQIARKKFPFLLKYHDIIYPEHVYLEQSSGEATARFKAGLYSGDSILDLSAGFGIDSLFLSKSFEKITLVEPNNNLLSICRYNFEVLGVKNATFENQEAENFLSSANSNYDLIYIDPSRRTEGRRFFKIEDCQPNILALLPELKKRSGRLLVKLSPMTDISDTLIKIPEAENLFVCSAGDECKEILVSRNGSVNLKTKFTCVDVGTPGYEFSFYPEDEAGMPSGKSKMKAFAYLPDSAISKAGCFRSIEKKFNVNQISANTHIFTSARPEITFPGKKFEVLAVGAYQRKSVQRMTKEIAFNIIIRNFPDNLREICAKLKIGHSGKSYLLAYRNANNEAEIALCRPL